MNPEQRFDVPAHVVARELEGELVVLNLETGLYFGLDEVGVVIWERLTDGDTLEGATAAVVERYDVDRERAETDIVALVEKLREASLVEEIE